MADNKGKSGSPINPFEEMSRGDSHSNDKEKGKKERWNEIEKGVSEVKRENLKETIKEEVKDKAKRKRKRPRTRNKISRKQPKEVDELLKKHKKGDSLPKADGSFRKEDESLPEANDALAEGERDAFKNPFVPSSSEQVSDFDSESESVPVSNPFDPNADKEKLPPKEYEGRYSQEQGEQEEEDELTEDSLESEQDSDLNVEKEEFLQDEPSSESYPVNPFEPSSENGIVEDRPLDSTTLDKRDDGVDPIVNKEDDQQAPEELHQSEEHLGQSSENFGNENFGNENWGNENIGMSGNENVRDESMDQSEGDVSKSNIEGKVSEVREVKPEDNSISEMPTNEVSVETKVTDGSNKTLETGEFKEEFWDILEQAGFTKQRLITIGVVIVLGIIVLIGWGSGWFGGSSSDDSENLSNSEEIAITENIEKEDTENLDANAQIDGVSENGNVVLKSTYAVEEQTKLNQDNNGALIAIEMAFEIGGIDQTFEEQIVYYIELIRKMESMYDTDVYALIDQSVDRREVLMAHLEEMDALIREGNSAYNAVVAAMSRYDAEFEVNADNKAVYEEQFFNNVSALLPKSSYNSLNTFIDLSKDSVELKAEFNAYKIIRDMMGASLDALEPRYSDINSNVEALIKGIRVFDIPNSDIDAIIPVVN